MRRGDTSRHGTNPCGDRGPEGRNRLASPDEREPRRTRGCQMTPLVQLAGISKSFAGVARAERRRLRRAARRGACAARRERRRQVDADQDHVRRAPRRTRGDDPDRRRRRSASPARSEAQAAGIATVYQELLLFPELTVAENIFLGPRAAHALGRRSTGARCARARARAARLARHPRSRRRLPRSARSRSPTASGSRSPRRCRRTPAC